MSYEDSFEREAADQRAHDRFECRYIYENLKPQNIGNWEWLLMFYRPHSYSGYAEAAQDASEMARELGRPVEIHSPYEGCFTARPNDYHKFPEGSASSTYESKKADFIKILVIEGRYPDLVKIANEKGDPDMYGISRHYSDETVTQHGRWRDAAKQ